MSHLLLRADARRIPLADRSVHCVVCSPPYWSLRDYGTGRWEGGDAGCDHTMPRLHKDFACGRGEGIGDGYSGRNCTSWTSRDGTPYRDVCGKCGARRVDRQLGLEPTPEAYVAAMVAVFREVKRVLRDDGTAWVNLGDSFNSSPSNQQGHFHDNHAIDNIPRRGNGQVRQRREIPGLKPKDLCGIPWRVAFALQADGWYLRSDIIWAKPNPMPESVTDRPTKSHEYLFLLSKCERYFFDADAVREAQTGDLDGRTMKLAPKDFEQANDSKAADGFHGRIRSHVEIPGGRNLRSVWTIATEAYPGAHFATYPRKLVQPCIKAGTSERGVCPSCGAPWEREVERDSVATRPGRYSCTDHTADLMIAKGSGGNVNLRFRPEAHSITLGWRPTCTHDLPPVPATVLDPFAGSGTTLLVAEALGRRAIGLDLSAEYLALARRRITRPHSRIPRPASSRVECYPLFPNEDPSDALPVDAGG